MSNKRMKLEKSVVEILCEAICSFSSKESQ